MIEFFGSISLNPGNIHRRMIAGSNQRVSAEKQMNYNLAATFDSTVKVFICTDPSSSLATFACQIKILRFWFTYISLSETNLHLYGVYRNLLNLSTLEE